MLYDEKQLSGDAGPWQVLTLPIDTVGDDDEDAGQSPDGLLWDAFRNGDERAFTRIYSKYSIPLYHFGCKYTTDRELVRDCLQDLFLYLRKNRRRLGSTNSIRLYLLKSFGRRITAYLKKEKCQVTVSNSSESVQFGIESSSEVIYINSQLKAEQLDKLSKALQKLDRTEFTAIYFFYYKGLTYEQIAGIFKFSHVSSARRVMYRSIKQLRHFFSYS